MIPNRKIWTRMFFLCAASDQDFRATGPTVIGPIILLMQKAKASETLNSTGGVVIAGAGLILRMGRTIRRPRAYAGTSETCRTQ